METKGNEPLFSQGGYSIWKIESEGQSDQKKSKESENSFVVRNCFGAEVGSFDNEKDARELLNQKIQQSNVVRDLLEKLSNLSQIVIFVGLFFSFLIGYLISFTYFSRYNQLWLFPKIISDDSIKLFFIGFVFAIFMFYIPIFYGFFIRKLNVKYYFLYNLFGIILIFILTWIQFRQLFALNINTILKYIVTIFLYPVIIGLLIHVAYSFPEKTQSHNYHSLFNKIPYCLIILLIPIFLFGFPSYTNFSKLVFKMTGMGARIVSLQLPNDDLSTLSPELRMILYKLNSYSNVNEKYCLFAQTNQELYITQSYNFCIDPSFEDHVGDLIRVPMKYIISIGEPYLPKNKPKVTSTDSPPSPTPPPSAAPQ